MKIKNGTVYLFMGLFILLGCSENKIQITLPNN